MVSGHEKAGLPLSRDASKKEREGKVRIVLVQLTRKKRI